MIYFIRVRKQIDIQMKIFHLALILLLALFVSSQVIGIDFGTEFWKASLISPGKNLVIVENTRSNRKSNNAISFLDGVRHFEYDAYQKRMKKPKTSYVELNKLIESLDGQTPVIGYQFANGTYYLQNQKQEKMSLEQVVGMILKNIKIYGSAQAESDIKDAVLSVPAHWGFRAKMSLVNAAYLADLSILGLIIENSAAAIHYGISRNDTEPINVGFFNLGSHNLQISIARFFGTRDPVKDKYIESIQILGHVVESDVGGLRVDRQIAEYIIQEFKAKNGLNIKQNERAYIKLLHKCADLKETLSANKEANIYVEGILDGIDLNMIVKREVIENLPIFDKIKQKLSEVLTTAGLTKSEIQSVQMIGGASRIPLVNKIVKEFFDPAEVGAHINGDQSMAFGSALRAANLSIAFRVKQLYFYDGLPLQVKAVISTIQDGVINETLLFDRNSEQGLRKQIILDENDQDLKATIYYGQQILHEYVISNISSWKQKYNESVYNFTTQPKTHLVFVANSITVAELKQAYVNITLNNSNVREVVEYVAEEDNSTENATEQTEEQVKTQQIKTEGQSQDNTTQTNQTITNQTNTNSTENSATEQKTKKKRAKKINLKTKKVTKLVEQFKIVDKKHSNKFTQTFCKYPKFSKEEISEKKQILLTYEKHENEIKQRAKIRNDFESTLYKLKDDFQNPTLKTFSTQEEMTKLKEIVAEQLVWMEENAWTAEKKQFQKHFDLVYKVYQPIVNRSQEYRDRQKSYNQTIEFLSMTYSKTVELNISQPWVSEKALQHLKKINETVEWIHEQLKEQVKLELNKNPILYNNDMLERAQKLRDQYYLIKMIPRPKVKKVVIEDKPAEEKPASEESVNLDDEQKGKQDQEKREQQTNNQKQHTDNSQTKQEEGSQKQEEDL